MAEARLGPATMSTSNRLHLRKFAKVIESSASSLDSQEMLLRALEEVSTAKKCICRGTPLTKEGNRRQLVKMLILVFVPVIVLLAICFYYVAETVAKQQNIQKTREIMEYSTELGGFLRVLQRERDQSVLYLSSIGPATKTYLVQTYPITDDALDNLSVWPVDLQRSSLQYFKTKKTFAQHINMHRNSLGVLNQTVMKEIAFYEEAMSVFKRWMLGALNESRSSTIWRPLVAYQKVSHACLDAGVERSLGVYFFASGGFKEEGTLEMFITLTNTVRASFHRATKYSDLVEPLKEYHIQLDSGEMLEDAILRYRTRILMGNISAPEPHEASAWFDTDTIYLDKLTDIQTDLSKKIISLVRAKEYTHKSTLAAFVLTIILVIVCVPVLGRAIVRTTSDIHNFAITLSHKTTELNREKRKTDSLLHQMLPRKVLKELKHGQGVNAEYFKEATIFFSDVVGFTAMTKTRTPMEIVGVLNELYNLFDEKIEHHDVYKVETIKDSYMLASGLPQRNGDDHAKEIANIALELVEACNHLKITSIDSDKLRVRIGINTGPVMAGIVGTKLPRYCLFGDTVNVASRLETNGEANKIHLSATTYALLKKIGGYKIKLRGTLYLKGKGDVTTYWLLGSDNISIEDRRIRSAEPMDCTSVIDLRAPGKERTTEGRTPHRASQQNQLFPLRFSPIPSTSTGLTHTEDTFPPPSYADLERDFERQTGSPYIVQLTEGYHF